MRKRRMNKLSSYFHKQHEQISYSKLTNRDMSESPTTNITAKIQSKNRQIYIINKICGMRTWYVAI
jgi:hypothetical protein